MDNIFIHFILDRIWRHGQVVRRGTANPLSPVQIRVSPDQPKIFDFLFCRSNSMNYCSARSGGKELSGRVNT